MSHQLIDPVAGEAQAAGAEANARITSATGMLLLVMLAVEGFTILSVRQMITLHIVLGIMLLGPVLLKSLTTTYRFARYYAGTPAYVRKGPPHPVLRVLGPIVILSSLAVLGTGIGLLFDTQRGTLLLAHKASFVVWFVAMTVHVLGHLREAAVNSWRELRPAGADRVSRGRAVRLAVVGLALLVGVGTAAALFPSSSPWTNHSVGAGGDH